MTKANRLPAKRGHKLFQPSQAWGAILLLVLITVGGVFGGASKILNVAFPVGSFLVGGFLYFRYPILYNGFSWWIWFLVAFVRRIVDLRAGYTEPSLILLAPHLVMGFTFINLWKQLPRVYHQGGQPFIWAIYGVLYGFCVALINGSAVTATISLLDWIVPISYGFYVFVHWRDYPIYRQNLQTVFVWGALVMGAYGVYQYLVAPQWDMDWLNNSKMLSANGYHDKAEAGPMAIRVFSTMHSVEPFASVMTGAALIVLNANDPIQFPAIAFGYLGLLLTLVRSAWVGWVAGFLTLFISLKATSQIRLVIIFFIAIMCLLPVAGMGQFSDNIGNRLQSLSQVQEDDSASGRQEAFNNTIGSALTSFVGSGILRESYDSSLFNLMFNLGWIGALPYLSGMILISVRLFKSPEGRHDPFLVTTRGIIVSCLIKILVNNIVFGASSVLLWGFLGTGMAAVKYHQHQRILGEN